MLEKSFPFAAAEAEIAEAWEARQLFACHPESEKPPFCIVIPPPNVTGDLHIGHALDSTVQDALCRFKRMKGFDVLWQPGTDHAGIATQMVVERRLAKQGLTRHDLGREKFIEKVWEWKAESGGQIIKQLHKLGASCDWSRERFTMDEGLSRAVRKVFVRLYKDNLIYKDKRLVNWDPQLQTAISDLEVVQKETVGTMWYFKYPVEGNPQEAIVIATTRPETMFGDTAVAVSADDERYKHLIGKNVILPILNRPIPVIADEHADPEKGTGAVKITPAHDFNDFEVGKRHQLPLINILDKEARLNENVPPQYRGMTCLEARPLVLEEIKALGLSVKEEDNPMTLPYGDRSDVIIEPWLTDQWFVDAPVLAKKAIEVVQTGAIQLVPKNWENTYFEWMNNIQPWCISRQLWWGHQVPVWYGPDGKAFCEETPEEAKQAAAAHYGKPVDLTQDTDVLDTWFSSGLWAFSTLGWPDETVYLKRYYPTTTLMTAFDIIFFWVARMIMISLYAIGEIPFKQVYLHGLVRDEKGQKMSKSKGNGIDPLPVIEKYGADALRFALLSQAGHGRDIPMSEKHIETYRNFVTKIWNAIRFCEMNQCLLDGSFPPQTARLGVNKWILKKLSQTAKEIEKRLETYNFNEASQALYHFIWGTFCDRYLEAIKPLFYQGEGEAVAETRGIAGFVVTEMLKLIHPFMPFVSEELWRKTAARNAMLMEARWPQLETLEDDGAAQGMDWIFELATLVRSMRSETNIPPAANIELHLKDASEAQENLLRQNEAILKALIHGGVLRFVSQKEPKTAVHVLGALTLMIPLEGVLDIAKEKERLSKEAAALAAFIEKTDAQLQNADFKAKAPPKILAEKQEALQTAKLSLHKVEETLKTLGES